MSQSIKYRSANRGAFGGFDKLLLLAVGGLLVMGTLLVYAGTREWFRSYGLDPEYYLKRHSLNIIIGGLLAYGTTLIDYRLLRAYTPIVWLAAVIGLVIVLIPGFGTEINGARAWIGIGSMGIQPAEFSKIASSLLMAKYISELSVKQQTVTTVFKAISIAFCASLLSIASMASFTFWPPKRLPIRIKAAFEDSASL